MKFLRFLKNILIKYLLKLGFVNQYRFHVDGPISRLIIKDTSGEVDIKNKIGCVNTIFNTGSGDIKIGDGVIFGHNVMVLTGKHDYTNCNKNSLKYDVVQNRDIVIEKGVWIASGAIILGNVNIGKHSVVMADSIVTKDIPSHSVVAGIPAKIVRDLKVK